jgi:hypothetical protein
MRTALRRYCCDYQVHRFRIDFAQSLTRKNMASRPCPHCFQDVASTEAHSRDADQEAAAGDPQTVDFVQSEESELEQPSDLDRRIDMQRLRQV